MEKEWNMEVPVKCLGLLSDKGHVCAGTFHGTILLWNVQVWKERETREKIPSEEKCYNYYTIFAHFLFFIYSRFPPFLLMPSSHFLSSLPPPFVQTLGQQEIQMPPNAQGHSVQSVLDTNSGLWCGLEGATHLLVFIPLFPPHI
jgi:hypothetical protein